MLNRSSLALTVAVGGLLSCAAATARASYSYGVLDYTDVVDTFAGSPFTQINTMPAVNNAGNVAYTALDSSYVLRTIRQASGTGVRTTVMDTTQSFSNLSGPTLTNHDVVTVTAYATVAFPGGGHNGIYTGTGGPTTFVGVATGGSSGRTNDAGVTLYSGYSSTGYPQFKYTTSGGATTVVATYNGGQFESLTDAAINNSNQVAFNTDDYSTGNNNGAFVYRYTDGTLITIGRATSQTSVGINDAGVVSYEGSVVQGSAKPTAGIFASDGVTVTTISQIHQALPGTSLVVDAYGANNEGIAINNSNLVAFLAANDSHTSDGIFVGDGTTTTRLTYLGQPLFGKTVNGFSIGHDAINDAGQVVFSVTFTDGTAAVVLTSGVVPEPASAVLLMGGALALLGRRGRRAAH